MTRDGGRYRKLAEEPEELAEKQAEFFQRPGHRLTSGSTRDGAVAGGEGEALLALSLSLHGFSSRVSDYDRMQSHTTRDKHHTLKHTGSTLYTYT